MGFPTVKSDPWKKKRKTRRFQLWSATFIKEITDLGKGHLTDEVVRRIGDINEWLYGKR